MIRERELRVLSALDTPKGHQDLRELADRLADVTGDDTYTRVLGDQDITSY